MMRRRANKIRGIKAEHRTLAFLRKHGGSAHRVVDAENPDLVWRRYAVEVKSTLTVTDGRASRIGITRKQWEDTKVYAQTHNFLMPVVIVEIIVRGSFYMYWLLTGGIIEEKMRNNYASFSLWQVFRHGIKIGVDPW